MSPRPGQEPPLPRGRQELCRGGAAGPRRSWSPCRPGGKGGTGGQREAGSRPPVGRWRGEEGAPQGPPESKRAVGRHGQRAADRGRGALSHLPPLTIFPALLGSLRCGMFRQRGPAGNAPGVDVGFGRGGARGAPRPGTSPGNGLFLPPGKAQEQPVGGGCPGAGVRVTSRCICFGAAGAGWGAP